MHESQLWGLVSWFFLSLWLLSKCSAFTEQCPSFYSAHMRQEIEILITHKCWPLSTLCVIAAPLRLSKWFCFNDINAVWTLHVHIFLERRTKRWLQVCHNAWYLRLSLIIVLNGQNSISKCKSLGNSGSNYGRRPRVYFCLEVVEQNSSPCWY